MPAMPPSSERLRSATIHHTARLPPRHRNGSIDTTSVSAPSSSVAGISIMKPAKAASSRPLRRRTPSIDDLTPFDAHLKDIYAGKADAADGLAFFESHGYYDVPEANTVDMFRTNFGMKKQFWDGADHELVFYEEINLDTVDLAALEVLSVGTLLTSATTSGVKRHRTTSGRFQLLDDDGNVVDPESHMEAEREKRMKLQHMEVDDDDAEELANAQVLLVKAITVIRTEHTRFKKYFYEACTEEMNRQQSVAVVPAPAPALAEVNVPGYSGYLYVLKDTIPHLFRSWHKRWVYLDFDNGLARMYKRSYWKSERGVLDMRSVRAITRMNQSDICIQCYDGRSMLFRTKDGSQEAEMWLNFLQVARRKFGTGSAVVVSPNTLQLAQPLAKNEKMALTTTTTTTTTTMSAGSILISTKVGKPQDRTMLDVVALLAKASTPSAASTSAGTNSVTAA